MMEFLFHHFATPSDDSLMTANPIQRHQALCSTTIVLPKRSNVSPVQSVVPATDLQATHRTEGCVRLHCKFLVSKLWTMRVSISQISWILPQKN